MPKKIITINGDNFSDLEGFFNEIDRILTKDLDWKTGHNFHAFNDLLWGGFGVHDYDELINLIWTNFSKSEQALEIEHINLILRIIKEHEHIEFSIVISPSL